MRIGNLNVLGWEQLKTGFVYDANAGAYELVMDANWVQFSRLRSSDAFTDPMPGTDDDQNQALGPCEATKPTAAAEFNTVTLWLKVSSAVMEALGSDVIGLTE